MVDEVDVLKQSLRAVNTNLFSLEVKPTATQILHIFSEVPAEEVETNVRAARAEAASRLWLVKRLPSAEAFMPLGVKGEQDPTRRDKAVEVDPEELFISRANT